MFQKKLVALIFAGLVISSLGACSSSPVDSIIDRHKFLTAESACRNGKGEALRCVMKVFARLADEYCAENRWSSSHPKCVELQKQVDKKVNDYFLQNLVDGK